MIFYVLKRLTPSLVIVDSKCQIKKKVIKKNKKMLAPQAQREQKQLAHQEDSPGLPVTRHGG